MPARRGQPGPPRPHNGRPPALIKNAELLAEQIRLWLTDNARAARIPTEVLEQLGPLLRGAEAWVTIELSRRMDMDD